MAKEFAIRFYNSKTWKQCRASYIVSVQGLCEQCLRDGIVTTGYILDHIVELSPMNINDVDITLNHNNLQFLCLSCHNKKTFGNDYEVIREGLCLNNISGESH